MIPDTIMGHFKLWQADGIHCAQVLVYDLDDLVYWIDQARATGHLMMRSYRVPKNGMGHIDPAHDVYQIYPPEVQSKIKSIYPYGKEIDL